MFPLLAAMGCTSTPAYTLALTPVSASNPDPFEDVDRYELVVDPGSDAELRLPMTVDGTRASGADLPPIVDVRLAVEGYAGDALRLRGLTERLTARDGRIEATVFVARAGSTTWLPGLSQGLYTPMVAALGDGDFWIGGGATNNLNNLPAKGVDEVLELSLAPPEESLLFVQTGTLPAYDDADGAVETARVGASVTALLVDGADQGKLLVAGGASADPLAYDGQSTKAVSLYDPSTGEWEELLNADGLGDERVYHVAIENTLGNVVVAGGLAEAKSGGANLQSDIEMYSRADRGFSLVGAGEAIGHLDLFAADLGDEGTLLCGGAMVSGSGFDTSSACLRVPLDGSSLESFQALPAPLVGAAMVRLEDGRILLAGGATPTGTTSSAEDVPARTAAWLYNPETGFWGALSAHLSVARAGHEMTRLADGRVLIVGGAESYNMDGIPADGLSCLEIYDPPTGTFTAVDGCTSADDAGGLQGRTPRLRIANDPEFGVLIAGGLGIDGSAQSAVSLYVPGE